MRKRFALIFMCLIMTVTVFGGCALFPRNEDRFQNRVVAEVDYKDGTKLTINKKELITGFNNYGYNFIQNYGYTTEEAVKATLDLLINRKVVLTDAQTKITLSNKDKNELWTNAFEALRGNLDTFEKEVLESWGQDSPVGKDEDKDIGTIFKPYEKKATVVFENGNYVIKIIDNKNDTEEELKNDYSTDAGKTSLKNSYNDYIGDSKSRKAAQQKYIKQLLKNETGLNLSKDAETVFQRESDRIYKALYENKMIEKYEEFNKDASGNASITTKQMLDYYKLKVLQSQAKYKVDAAAYNTAMLDSVKDVNYYINSDYFFVSHVLIKFNDAQKVEYSSLETLRDNGSITPKEYEDKLNLLISSITATERDSEGKKVDSAKSADEVLQEMHGAIDGKTTDTAKAEAFNEFIYRYNEDDGIMNADYNYVIGLNESKMVESFTKASRELDKNGSYGGLSDVVPSEHGVHIIFYAGRVSNIFMVSDPAAFQLNSEDILELTKKRLNDCKDKTVFDLLYESMLQDNYSMFENANIRLLKKDLVINKYDGAMKDLY